jgi:hypothetical protein
MGGRQANQDNKQADGRGQGGRAEQPQTSGRPTAPPKQKRV